MDINLKRYPFALLLGLSLAIHLLVLMSWPALPPQPLHLALPSAAFSIHLQHNDIKTESSPAHPASSPATAPVPESVSVPALRRTTSGKAHEARQTVIKPEPIAKKAQAKLTATTNTLGPLPTARPGPLAKTVSAISQNHVISRLQLELKQYFYYPRLAQRQNIQGTVIIGFAINLQGQINNIRILKSSGFAVLDMAAEDALQKLRQIDWDQERDRPYLQRDNSDIKLPVIYKLTES